MRLKLDSNRKLRNMKHLATVFFVFFSIIINGQNASTLNEIYRDDIVPAEGAIIYGNFIQRLGFSSGGFPQDIKLINLETNEIFSQFLSLKKTFSQNY